jgi:hypothetical protein
VYGLVAGGSQGSEVYAAEGEAEQQEAGSYAESQSVQQTAEIEEEEEYAPAEHDEQAKADQVRPCRNACRNTRRKTCKQLAGQCVWECMQEPCRMTELPDAMTCSCWHGVQLLHLACCRASVSVPAISLCLQSLNRLAACQTLIRPLTPMLSASASLPRIPASLTLLHTSPPLPQNHLRHRKTTP